nr:MAG TPA: N6 adenosine methyltransferase subunit [Caudoviricetes sp.]
MGIVDIFNTTNKYDIIYADPPWEYKQSGSTKNARGMAKQHYPTMPTDDIGKLPVRSLATDNAILFMWATFPNIPAALEVIKQWGFIYKTAAFVWVKKNKKSDSLFWGDGCLYKGEC